MLALRPAAPARRPRVRGAGSAQIRASSRSRSARAAAPAKPPDFDPQPRTIRFIGALARKCPRHECIPAVFLWPRLGQRAGEREQHRSPREGDHLARVTHHITACIHDQRLRCQQRFDLLEQQRVAPRHGQSGAPRACSGPRMRFQLPPSAQGCRPGTRRCGPGERCARRVRPQAPHRNPRNHQFVGGPGRGRERRRFEPASVARPRPGARSAAAVGPPDTAHVRRSRRSPCASSVARAASSAFAGQPRSRETSAISPRRRRTSRAPRPPSDRRHAPRVAAAASPARDRRAAPWRYREARALARLRATRSASTRRADHRPPSARAAAVISESIEIPPHLSLPLVAAPVLVSRPSTTRSTPTGRRK